MAIKSIFRAVVALFALCFTTLVVAEFPSSSIPPTSEWKIMSEGGFTGSLEDSCQLLALTKKECELYQVKHSLGTCDFRQVPNGVVLDSMVFTRNGRHLTQFNLEVALISPPSRDAQVCMLGKKAVIRFSGCNNVAVVNNWSPKSEFVYQRQESKSARSDSYPEPQTCPGGDPERRYFSMVMYSPKAVHSECASLHVLPHNGMVSDGGPVRWGDMDAFSVFCGKVMHNAERAGELALGVERHEVEIVIIDNDQEWLLFKGKLVGDTLIPASAEDKVVMSEDKKAIFIPETFQDGLVAVHFLDYSKIRTPVQSGIAYSLSEFNRGCRLMRYTGIDMPSNNLITYQN